MIRRWFGLLFAALLPVLLAAAEPPEPELWPLDPELSLFEAMRPYYLAVRDRLIGGDRRTGVVVFPSFRREWGLHVLAEGDRTVVRLSRFERSLWGTMNQAAEHQGISTEEVLRSVAVPVGTQSAPLGQATAAAVERAWTGVLEGARQPAEARAVLDGTSYLFFAPASRSAPERIGLARSPQAGTPEAALAALAEALRAFVESPAEERSRTEQDLLRRANDVTAQALDRRVGRHAIR